jgi:hypothetical protein
MPKFQKEPGTESKIGEKKSFNEDFAFRSLIITTIVGVACFIISILVNVVEVYNIINIQNSFFDLIDVIIRISVVLLFFFFMTISLGNYKDLLGKPSNWKEITLLFFFSILQTMRNVYVFGFTFLGLLIIICYLYLIQDS